MVTDVDVVAHDYNLNFYHRRLYAECKGGRNKSVLDRVVWVRGVKEMIGADHPHLVIDHCDPVSVQFARTLGVEILQAAGLNALESALRIGPTFWPGRANLAAYQPVEASIKRIVDRSTAGDLSEWLAQASEIWRDASALALSYGKLNSLLGAIESCSAVAAKSSPDAAEARRPALRLRGPPGQAQPVRAVRRVGHAGDGTLRARAVPGRAPDGGRPGTGAVPTNPGGGAQDGGGPPPLAAHRAAGYLDRRSHAVRAGVHQAFRHHRRACHRGRGAVAAVAASDGDAPVWVRRR